jgi:hypothetical protein
MPTRLPPKSKPVVKDPTSDPQNITDLTLWTFFDSHGGRERAETKLEITG